MAVTHEKPLASRTSRLILGSAIAMCVGAAVAAAPSASTGTTVNSPVKAAISLNGEVIRPLAPGPGIRVGRAFDGEDEDCTLVMTPTTDKKGHAAYARELSCVN
jgi:hypothetical protein